MSYMIEKQLVKAMKSASPFGKWYYNLSLFNRYGLYRDDLLRECYNPEVAEAVRRLPRDMYDERVFRLVRASQLEITKSYLPKEQWTQCEDPKNWYLGPYIQEVEAEWQEKKDWADRHPQ